jgi:hypothetical protein
MLQLERPAVPLARPGVKEDLHQRAVTDLETAQRRALRVGEQVVDAPGCTLERR